MNTSTKTALISIAATVITSLCLPRTAAAESVRWTHWQSAIAGPDGSAIGNILLADGSRAQVNYSGQLAFWDAPGSNTYWQDGGSTYTSAAVDNGPGNSGMLALSRLGTRTLSFSQAVDNLFFALIGLNDVGYEFDRDFTIESSGPGHDGSGSFTKVLTADGKYRLTGTGEPHGVIRFSGAVSSITWSSLADETWNGFTIGTYGAPVSSVPEPGTWALMGLGMLGMGWVRRAGCTRAG